MRDCLRDADTWVGRRSGRNVVPRDQSVTLASCFPTTIDNDRRRMPKGASFAGRSGASSSARDSRINGGDRVSDGAFDPGDANLNLARDNLFDLRDWRHRSSRHVVDGDRSSSRCGNLDDYDSSRGIPGGINVTGFHAIVPARTVGNRRGGLFCPARPTSGVRARAMARTFGGRCARRRGEIDEISTDGISRRVALESRQKRSIECSKRQRLRKWVPAGSS